MTVAAPMAARSSVNAFACSSLLTPSGRQASIWEVFLSLKRRADHRGAADGARADAEPPVEALGRDPFSCLIGSELRSLAGSAVDLDQHSRCDLR